MIAAWFLIITVLASDGTAMIQVPQFSEAVCQKNAAKYFYAVECSDHFRLWGELPYAQQEKNIDIGMHMTPSLKEARKACTQFRSGKLKKDGKFQ